jgi:murein DD-endopeptidase MepM/ murein hydrolase activator NlpD
MPRPIRSYQRTFVARLGVLILAAWVAALSSRPSSAHAASLGGLQQQISKSKGTVSGLAGAVSAASAQVNHLGNSISALEAQITSIQADLDAKRAELVKLRSDLNAARAHLARLQAYLVRANALLTDQLVNSYESDSPDLVTVVLDATGFQDLLEKLSFQQRVRKSNAVVIGAVRAARRAVVAEATHLGALEVRQQALTAQVLVQRNRLYGVKVTLVNRQIAAQRVRDHKAGKLSRARGKLSDLEGQLAALQRQQAAQAAAAARAALQRAAQQAAASDAGSSSSSSSSSSSAPAAAPPSAAPVSGSGGFVFPLPKGSVGGPGTWTPDDGVDMAAPGDTPEYAVCSGTIVLHGIGGFGPWAPVLHCDSAVGGYSYVYYGHAGPLYQLSVGTHVGAGQVISSIGPGIVGFSTGPHIEIGFCDGSGTPIGPGSAGAMMSLLQSSW